MNVPKQCNQVLATIRRPRSDSDFGGGGEGVRGMRKRYGYSVVSLCLSDRVGGSSLGTGQVLIWISGGKYVSQ